MYRLLLKFLPPLLAEVGAIIWYVLLILLVFFAWGLPQVDFKYGNM